MLSTAAAAAAGALPSTASATSGVEKSSSKAASHAGSSMTSSTLTMKDGTIIYCKDWGSGPAVVFSHGWPLTADAWEDQMVFPASNGYRVIAHDRLGHGRSGQSWSGNDMDTYSDDLAALVDHLDLHGAAFVAHSTGGGEVARYLGRHGTRRAGGAVQIGAVTPLMLKTQANPGGLPIEVFDGIRAGVSADRWQFFKDLSMPFYGYNRAGAKVSEGVRNFFWLQSMMGGLKGELDCIKQFWETDFTGDLKRDRSPELSAAWLPLDVSHPAGPGWADAAGRIRNVERVAEDPARSSWPAVDKPQDRTSRPRGPNGSVRSVGRLAVANALRSVLLREHLGLGMTFVSHGHVAVPNGLRNFRTNLRASQNRRRCGMRVVCGVFLRERLARVPDLDVARSFRLDQIRRDLRSGERALHLGCRVLVGTAIARRDVEISVGDAACGFCGASLCDHFCARERLLREGSGAKGRESEGKAQGANVDHDELLQVVGW